LDALNKSELAIPKHIVQLEADLKKQWTKKEKVATAVKAKSTKAAPAGSSTATSKKRKAPGTTPALSLINQRPNSALDGGSEPSRSKQTARRGGITPGFARRGGAAAPVLYMRDSSRTESEPKRPRQTARRGGGSLGVTRPHGSGAGLVGDDHSGHSQVKAEEDIKPPTSPPSSRGSQLGLLNGTYEIECADLDQWDQFQGHNFSLILSLQGTFIWGAYDFGMYSGILCMPRRPFQASEERFTFTWRGRENSEGQMSFGSSNHGWIQFLGGGRIRGMINCYGEASFEGRRVSAGTKSERNAQDMRNEWGEYNDQQYEYERRARW
jgi:hypothetical protein